LEHAKGFTVQICAGSIDQVYFTLVHYFDANLISETAASEDCLKMSKIFATQLKANSPF
jgi:hypothetical protein